MASIAQFIILKLYWNVYHNYIPETILYNLKKNPISLTIHNLSELATQLFCLFLRQAGRRSRIGWVPHGSAHGDVGQALGWLADQASVGGVQVDVCRHPRSPAGRRDKKMKLTAAAGR